ncbi:MAG: phospholipase [Gammaproteobacteria bacterium]|nr:phospholipase [Gammaproteobacteria bacterium]
MPDDTDALLDAITALMPPVLTGLETLSYIGRHMHPPNLRSLVDAVQGTDEAVKQGLEQFRRAEWPAHLERFAEHVDKAAQEVCSAFEGLEQAVDDPNGMMQAYRSMRHNTRAVEALYPIASMLPPVSRFFLEPGYRDDQALLKKLAEADASRENVGIMHANNEKGTRGGFSMYVPEYYDESESYPLIMAMHGGSGHGADFLWTWITAARSRGAIVISPTAKGDTWSLMGPDIDSPNLDAMVEHVAKRWSVNRDKLLLTGMSDGGTFSYCSGLRAESPFTHLAPSSASFHPLLLDGLSKERLQGLPIYLIHGVLDWMFPVDIARTANAALTAAGAAVVYREIEDLSHTYPRDENPRIMDWLLRDG